MEDVFMKLTMGHLVKGLAGVAVIAAIMLSQSDPAQAILEGSNRDRMEYLDFSENAIKASLYAKTGRATFNRDKRSFVRGIKRHNEPKIYQPDVYTWELAMAEHRKKLQAMNPAPVPTDNVAPVPMTADGIIPGNPAPVAVSPVGVDGLPETPGRTVGHTDFRAAQIKQKIIDHMNSLDARDAANNIPALQPAVYPRGHRGDSYDASY